MCIRDRRSGQQQHPYPFVQSDSHQIIADMIELKSIQKSFDGRMVIKDIDAVFETGRTNLIIGQSGSGKTVLLKCVVGLLDPDAGDILYDLSLIHI